MSYITCERKDCMYRDADDVCMRLHVHIASDGCDGYETVLGHPDYQDVFWAAIGTDGVVRYREERRGKRIELRGHIFYTQEPVDELGCYDLYDGKTGYLCGTYRLIDSNFSMFMRKTRHLPDIMTFPEKPREEERIYAADEPFDASGLLSELKKLYGE